MSQKILLGEWKMKVSKTKVPLSDGTFALYIAILEFRDEHQWEIMGKKVEQLVKEQKGRTKVFQGKVLRAFPTST